MTKDIKSLNINGKLIPAWYESVESEYFVAKESAGFFYREDLIPIFISGEERNRLIDKTMTTNLSEIDYYNFIKTALCNKEGKVIDILDVYVFGDGIFLLSNFTKAKEVIDMLKEEIGMLKCEVADISKKSKIYTFIGPKTPKIIEKIINNKPDFLKEKQFSIESFNKDELIIARSDSLGKYTFEIIIESQTEEIFLDFINKLNLKETIKPIGFMAYNILRIEKGIPNVINDFKNSSLIETKMDYLIDFDKPSFLGKDALILQKKKTSEKSIFLCVIESENILYREQSVFDKNEKKMGYITSSAYSPSLKKTLCIGFIENSMNFENNEVYFKVENTIIKGHIISS